MPPWRVIIDGTNETNSRRLRVGDRDYAIHRLDAVEGVDNLPFVLKLLVENLLRTGGLDAAAMAAALATRDPAGTEPLEIGFSPSRILMHDTTGVPALVDLATLRSAMAKLGGDPARVRPSVPVDLIIDHSLTVDVFGRTDAVERNIQIEYRRNTERYGFLRWAGETFDGITVAPPGAGIVHQVNVEHLAQVVVADGDLAYPDTLVGTDSHTTMVNGLGVLAWGVGGIEALAAMLGQGVVLQVPEVVGVELRGRLPEGATATDLVLRITELLRARGVVGSFVEFHGAGLAEVAVPDRTTIANMSPEFGSTCAMFPIDQRTIDYLELTGREPDQVALVEAYAREQGLWADSSRPACYAEELVLDLGTVRPSIAGPSRPERRIALDVAADRWREDVAELLGEVATDGEQRPRRPVEIELEGERITIDHGHVAIAAITSCTNTSNPTLMLGAGLLARNAVERGLRSKPWVKTSLAPGSGVVMDYYANAGLTPYLEKLGFSLVGIGCTTCIGNSGPLPEPVSRAVSEHGLALAAVLSGNRNFEGRISPDVRMNYLASPPLVVAYALAGTMDLDLGSEPLGHDDDGEPVYLVDIWPTSEEISRTVSATLSGSMFTERYADLLTGDDHWRGLEIPVGELFDWDEESTYLREAPYLDGMDPEPPSRNPGVSGARVLAILGDAVTTDHLSPAGAIPKDGPAGRHLSEHGVKPHDFNTFPTRRGNHQVMIRAALANPRLINGLVPEGPGGVTRDLAADGPVVSMYDAAAAYAKQGTPLVLLAGDNYGNGSSRDWAAKGPALLGVRAVIAGSFERIHRSNLVGMGVLPLEFLAGDSVASLGLVGDETFEVAEPETEGERLLGRRVEVVATPPSGTGRDPLRFEVTVRLDTDREVLYHRHGGIMPYVLRTALGQTPEVVS